MDERELRNLYERVARLETKMDEQANTARNLTRIFWSTLLIVGFTAVAAVVLQFIQHV